MDLDNGPAKPRFDLGPLYGSNKVVVPKADRAVVFSAHVANTFRNPPNQLHVFMFLDAFIGLIAVAGIALTAEFIGNFIGAANVSPESLGPVLGFLIAGIVIMMHLVVWGLLMMIVGAIASGVMKQTVFPCLWCGHELHPTVPDRCPECGIGLHEEELDRAGRRGAYRPISSNDSATNHFHDSPPNP